LGTDYRLLAEEDERGDSIVPVQIPASFAKQGYAPINGVGSATKSGLHRLMIGSEGAPDSGKTEFALSAPGPGQAICVDRGIDGVLDNPSPPTARQENWAYKVVVIPSACQFAAQGSNYVPYWEEFYKEWKGALANPDTRTVLLDGDSDTWELQRLAYFGKLTQIPSIQYTNVNAARRLMYHQAYDSGKIIIATNKIKKEYEDAFNSDGTPKVDNQGKQLREWKGEYKRQGFEDQEYLWTIQISHQYYPPRVNAVTKKTTPGEYGIKILKCKVNRDLVGTELRGADCNFQSLVQLVYPQITLESWGYR
jgi:hypothetical protein